MSNNVKIIVATSVVTGLAVASLSIWLQENSMSIFGAKIGPACPTKLADYCGRWQVKSTNNNEPQHHLEIPDEFRISATGWGVEPPIWLKANSQLAARWLNQPKIKLREIENAGNVDCMVGRIKLDTSHTGKDHAWHQLSLWTDERPVDGSTETVLEICISKLDNGGWPNQCEKLTSCTTAGSVQNHGGRAHAENN